MKNLFLPPTLAHPEHISNRLLYNYVDAFICTLMDSDLGDKRVKSTSTDTGYTYNVVKTMNDGV